MKRLLLVVVAFAACGGEPEPAHPVVDKSTDAIAPLPSHAKRFDYPNTTEQDVVETLHGKTIHET